jgi:hypothetical protein
MEWLRWYDNLIKIVLNFLMYLRSPKSELKWRNYGQNINRCIAVSTSYGPYRNSYDLYAPYQKIRTELAGAGWLIFLLYKTTPWAIIGHLGILIHLGWSWKPSSKPTLKIRARNQGIIGVPIFSSSHPSFIVILLWNFIVIVLSCVAKHHSRGDGL